MGISGYIQQLDVTENYPSMTIICVCVYIRMYIYTKTQHIAHTVVYEYIRVLLV